MNLPTRKTRAGAVAASLLVLPLLLVLLVVPARAEVLDLEEPTARLDRLKTLLSSSRSRSVDLLEGLDQVEASYLALLPALTPETKPAFAKWRKRAHKLYLKAFGLVKMGRRREMNIREDVNVRAAAIIGRTGYVALWKDVRRHLETRLFKARYEVPAPMLDAAFNAIAALGEPDALAWMAEEFIHTNSSPAKVVDRLVSAQQAFVRFPLERVPGKLRHAIVKKLVQLYPATETVARQSSKEAAILSTRRFWGRIGTGVIEAAQHFSGTPRDADGVALATMNEISEWFRDHKDARRAPWADPVPPRG